MNAGSAFVFWLPDLNICPVELAGNTRRAPLDSGSLAAAVRHILGPGVLGCPPSPMASSAWLPVPGCPPMADTLRRISDECDALLATAEARARQREAPPTPTDSDEDPVTLDQMRAAARSAAPGSRGHELLVDVAKDGRAICKLRTCRVPLKVGVLRLGRRPPSSCKVAWYHPECAMVAFATARTLVLEKVEDIDHGFDALSAADQARIRTVVDATARDRAPSAADIRQSAIAEAGGTQFRQPQQALYGTPRESEPPQPKRRRVEQSAPATSTGPPVFEPGCGGTCGEALDTLLEPLTDGGGSLGLACCVSVDGLVTKQAVNEDRLAAIINGAHKEWRFLGDRCRERVEFLKAVSRELKRKGKNRYFYSQKCRSHVGVVTAALAQIKRWARESGGALAQDESPAARTGPPAATVPHELAALGAAMTGAVSRVAAFEARTTGSAASVARPLAS